MINLLDIQPNVISRDLREKIIFIYGDPKTGKTATACKFPNPLLLAFEKGYNAIAGIRPLPINKWSEFKQALKQLRTEEVKQMYETIIVDTADIAYDLCEKFICQKHGVDTIGDIPYGAGYGQVEKEFDECLREIALLGYGLVIISHAEDKTFKDEQGIEFNKIVPTLNKRARKVTLRMADIIGYSRSIETEQCVKTMLFMRGTPRFEAGSRFKYTPPQIELTYDNLVNAIAEAIEKQEQEDGAVVVDKKDNVYVDNNVLDFDELMAEAQEIINDLMVKDENNGANIVKIVDTHLGKGKKLSQATEEQVEMIALIVSDLKDLLGE